MLRSGQEALDTGAAIGHRVLPIFGLTPDDVRQTNRLVETLLDTLLEGFVLPHTKTTVLQDWIKGRHSEVDDSTAWWWPSGRSVGERRRSTRQWSRLPTASSAASLRPAPGTSSCCANSRASEWARLERIGADLRKRSGLTFRK